MFESPALMLSNFFLTTLILSQITDNVAHREVDMIGLNEREATLFGRYVSLTTSVGSAWMLVAAKCLRIPAGK